MFAFIYLCWKTRVISSKYKLLMIQWSPFNYNSPFFYVQNDNIISVNKVCIELLIETTKFQNFDIDIVSDFHLHRILFTIVYFIVCNLNTKRMREKWQKAPVILHLLHFYCVSILFLSFSFHFILKRYVFIFACTVVFWLEQDGVHRIVRPIYTRFLTQKLTFCWNILI